jgi:hypothetical protein
MVSDRDRRFYDREESKRQRMIQLEKDQATGVVADSDSVRAALVEKMHAGEMTLEQVQSELKRIKREAKKAGRPIRDDYFKK